MTKLQPQTTQTTLTAGRLAEWAAAALATPVAAGEVRAEQTLVGARARAGVAARTAAAREAVRLLVATPAGVAEVAQKTHKVCGRCHEDKPVSDFNREAKKLDGLASWCKRCKCQDQVKRREEQLKHDADWRQRRQTFAKLARLIARGEVQKPTTCPWCGQAPAPREIQAVFANACDPRSVLWRCRSCALAQEGKVLLAVCRWCKEPFSVQRTTLRRGGGRYCTVRCRNTWMKTTAEHVRQVVASKRTSAEQVYLDDRF
jgi:hypothetical protein